jgi:hypothetical protein
VKLLDAAALSDEAVYVYDAHNRRIVRVLLKADAVRECPVP